MVLDIKSVLIVDGVGANCTEILNAHGISATNFAKISKDDLLKEVPVRCLIIYLDFVYSRGDCYNITLCYHS